MYVRDLRSLQELVKAIEGSPLLAIDTEFMRERTYWARLCLIQVATDDVCAIIDPIAIDDLSSLWGVFTDPATVKVLHAGSQDLEIFWREMGDTMRPVFDTQIAATIAGFPQQVGYAAIVKELLGVTLDKSDTYTDWSRRPLSDNQVEYALNDVRYLPDVHRILGDRLAEHDRQSWLAADFARLEDPATFDIDPEQMFKRLKKLSSLSRRQLGVLQQVAAWRELEARRRDIPRRWVVGDDSLVEIARRSPSSREELGAVRGVSDKMQKSAYSGVLGAVAKGRAMPEENLPRIDKRKRRPVDVDGAVDLMGALVRLRAKEHGVAVPLLASRDDLECLAAGDRDTSLLLDGWRRSIVGDELLELLEGRIALSLKDGALAVQNEDPSSPVENVRESLS